MSAGQILASMFVELFLELLIDSLALRFVHMIPKS